MTQNEARVLHLRTSDYSDMMSRPVSERQHLNGTLESIVFYPFTITSHFLKVILESVRRIAKPLVTILNNASTAHYAGFASIDEYAY